MDKRHFSPNKEDRQCKYFHPIYKWGSRSVKEFQRIEDLLDEMTVDFCNGLAKSDIYLKLCNGGYKNGKKVTEKIFDDYWRCIKSRLAIDRERDMEAVKDALYAKYNALYADAVACGNTIAAKSILDSLMKLTGVDKQQQNISIEPTGDVNIKFGFNDD